MSTISESICKPKSKVGKKIQFVDGKIVVSVNKLAMPKEFGTVVSEACWGHCCTHGGYGNDEW